MDRTARRRLDRAMRKQVKRQRAASGQNPSAVQSHPASRGVAPCPLYRREVTDPDYAQKALAGQALVGEVMLAGCPTFTTKLMGGQVVVVDEARVRPAICAGCGRIPEHVFQTGQCPRLLDESTAMAMLLPADVLHADPEEPALIVPG